MGLKQGSGSRKREEMQVEGISEFMMKVNRTTGRKKYVREMETG